MLRYHVRSRDLISLVQELNSGKLVKSPYFQRNLVWRDVHKKDFIDTILLGLPFPQIFIAQGEIDIETLESRSVVVDGQQRLNAIQEFVGNALLVNGRRFQDLDNEAREEFLRYQVPVIDLEIKAGDPQIIDIFKRLNRTFYALSTIERMSTEYATVDFMLIAKYACGVFSVPFENSADEAEENSIELHPLMPEDFLPWASQYETQEFHTWLLKSEIFSEFELARLVHLMFCLNLISTIYNGFFPRNEKTKEHLEEAFEQFPCRDEILSGLEKTATFINSLELSAGTFWYSKSNAFSLFIIVFWNIGALERFSKSDLKAKLNEFASNVPDEYALAAREAVNNRKQRVLRHEAIADLLGLSKTEGYLKR